MRCRHLLTILGISLLLAGCALPSTADLRLARATAVAGGCWPYAVVQPAPPPTPLHAGTPMPTLAPALTTPTPFAGPWPTCTPLPGTPTVTPSPTPWPTPIPPSTPLPVGSVPPTSGGLTEVGDLPGNLTSPMLASDPTSGRAVVGWISWGASAQPDLDGQVWVRVQQATGWGAAQTLTTAPVNKGNGGLGLAVTPTAIVAAWSPGPLASDPQIVLSASADQGATWSAPARTGLVGTVIALQADPQGGLHLLWLERPDPDGDPLVRYATAVDPAGPWQVAPPLASASWPAMAVYADGTTIVRVIGIVDQPDGVVLLRSRDGLTWDRQTLPVSRFMPETSRQHPALVAAPRGASAVVALVWAQYAEPGAFAVVSTDGGQTWSAEERIAQRAADQTDADGVPQGCCGSGYQPTVVYDAASDQLAATWLQRDYGTGLWRTFLAGRPLTDFDGPDWRWAMTPTQDAAALALSDPGWAGQLIGTPTGTAHWLLMQDGRNQQNRLSVRSIQLPAYLVPGES